MPNPRNTYSIYVATVYVFNLIFGSGVLLLVYAFWNVGYAIGTVLFIILAMFSLITCTYIVESMSLACALRKLGQIEYSTLPETLELEIAEESPSQLVPDSQLPSVSFIDKEDMDADLFLIDFKFELMDMAKIFLNKYVQLGFTLVTIVYLFGDLLVYLSVVGSSLQRMTCTDFNVSPSPGLKLCDEIGSTNVIRIYITLFTIFVGGLAFFNISKTKVIQFGTITLRWSAFLLMFILAWIRVGNKVPNDPHPGNFNYLPVFIGSGLYSFMCQHSLPGILYPIKERRKEYNYVFYIAIVLTFTLYLLLTVSGILAFLGEDIQEIYTLNFMVVDQGYFYIITGSFLQLFPVIALSSSYPIICITLRETIKNLVLFKLNKDTKLYFIIYRLVIPSVVILIPFLVITFVSDKVSVIVGIVGSYAGVFVQYIIPTLLVLFGRRKLISYIGKKRVNNNFQRSKFSHIGVIVLVFVWSALAISLVAYFHIQEFITNK